MTSTLSQRIMVFSEDSGNVEIGDETGAVFPPFTTTERDAVSSPKDGAVIFNTTDNELQTYHSGQWNGSAYGNMYIINNVTATTINTKDQFEDVLNFTQGELKEVTFGSDTLTTPDATITYEISYSACLAGSTNTSFEVAIEVDGIVRDESHSCTTIATGGNAVSLSGTFILTVGALKGIKLVVANKTNTSNVVIVDASVVVTRIRN